MQKKKFIITLLFAVLSIFMITACSDSSNESNSGVNNGGGGTVQPEPEPEPDKPTVKEFYSFAISSFYSNISQYAILSDGSLYAWGCNDHGQLGLGDNNYYYPSNAKKVDIPGNVKQLVSVITETYDYDTYTRYIMPSFYAITEDGELYAWGYNEDGRLGINNKDNQTKPVKVAGITGRINELIALEDNSNSNAITLSFYAITEDGLLYAWGDNSNGHLGVGDEINRNTPTKVNLPGKIKELITAENDSVFALMNDGSFYAWGNNNRFQLGVESSNSPVNTPNKVNLSGTIKEIITGESSFYTKLEDGSFYEFKEYSKPRKINLPGNIRELIEYNSSIYTILEDGTLYAWGSNGSGQLGVGDEVNRNIPTKVNLPGKIKELIADSDSVYAMLEDGTLYAWGDNYNGQLGVGDEVNRNIPAKVNLPGKIKELMLLDIGYGSLYATLEDGSLYVWGHNFSGEFGVVDEVNINTPTKVNLPGTIKELITGAYSFYAILEDGTLYAWGFNFSGRLGIGIGSENEYEYVNTPTKVNLPGTIKELITNVNSVYAILEDNSLYAWGYNENGQLGVGDYKNRNTPEKVIKIEGTIKKVIFSNNYQELINTNIIMDDGSLYGIGYDYASYPIKVKFDNQ